MKKLVMVLILLTCLHVKCLPVVPRLPAGEHWANKALLDKDGTKRIKASYHVYSTHEVLDVLTKGLGH